MRYWFTSDTHFNHYNIINYCDRPFKSAEHMDREIIRKWNERVKPDDTVFHLGDFMFGGSVSAGTKKKPREYLKQLNGKIIHIRGNHDNNNGLNTSIESMVLQYGGIGWWLQHKPEMLTYKYNLCGHVHHNWKIKRTPRYVAINLSVEVWNYYPVSINEILDRLTKDEVKENEETNENNT